METDAINLKEKTGGGGGQWREGRQEGMPTRCARRSAHGCCMDIPFVLQPWRVVSRSQCPTRRRWPCSSSPRCSAATFPRPPASPPSCSGSSSPTARIAWGSPWAWPLPGPSLSARETWSGTPTWTAWTAGGPFEWSLQNRARPSPWATSTGAERSPSSTVIKPLLWIRMGGTLVPVSHDPGMLASQPLSPPRLIFWVQGSSKNPIDLL